MSRAAKELLLNSPLLAFPIIGLGLFGLGFLFVLLTVRSMSKQAIDARARLPLGEEQDQ
jgi:hypothetical protein